MTHKINPIGNHIYSMVYDVKPEIIRDRQALDEIMNEAIALERFQLKSTTCVDFDGEPKAYTIVKIIGESHIIVSTYPGRRNKGCVELDITSCRSPDSGNIAFDYIISKLVEDPSNPVYDKRSYPSIKDINTFRKRKLLESSLELKV